MNILLLQIKYKIKSRKVFFRYFLGSISKEKLSNDQSQGRLQIEIESLKDLKLNNTKRKTNEVSARRRWSVSKGVDHTRSGSIPQSMCGTFLSFDVSEVCFGIRVYLMLPLHSAFSKTTSHY